MGENRNYNREESLLPEPDTEPGDMPSTEQLVVQAINGNTGAFGQLYKNHAEKIFRYVFYNTRKKDVSEDITQEVFLKAWTAIGSCRGKEKTFSSWLYRIAHNLMVDRIRRLNRKISLEVQSVEDRVDMKASVETRLEQQDLLKVLEFLPENQRRVIILKFIEGMENREIAGIMGKSEGAIRILQMRGLSLLRQELSKE